MHFIKDSDAAAMEISYRDTQLDFLFNVILHSKPVKIAKVPNLF